MTRALQRAWLRRGPLACLLWPLSLVYRAVTAIDAQRWKRGLRRRERAPVPVIVVGNVVAGGAGKTPVVIEIASHLATRGIACGVVSRGYGRIGGECREVTAQSAAAEVGDEPLLIARSAGVPVFVAARRIDAIRALLRRHPSTRVIVSDDGLQHHALERDVEVCVFDERGTGNGWLLPAGPLRESWPREVDFVLRPDTMNSIAGYTLARRLRLVATNGRAERIDVSNFKAQGIAAVAGIANPGNFFSMLRQAGLRVEREVWLDDHAPFASDPVPGEKRAIFCTEKDAAKLWKWHPGAWAVPLEVQVDPAFWTAFDRCVDAKLSSVHGSQAA